MTNNAEQIHAIKDDLVDKSAPFGVDLLIPQVGGSARKTNVSISGAFLNVTLECINPSSTTTPKANLTNLST